MSLWWPDSADEWEFLKSQGVSDTHIGYQQFHEKSGVINSDNSMDPGISHIGYNNGGIRLVANNGFTMSRTSCIAISLMKLTHETNCRVSNRVCKISLGNNATGYPVGIF